MEALDLALAGDPRGDLRDEPLEEPAPKPRPRLRVGVFAASQRQPRWVIDALGRIATSECAKIAVLALGLAAPEAPPPLWSLYSSLDRRMFGSGPDAAELLEVITEIPHEERIGLAAPASLVQWRGKVAALDLDVAFALDDVDDGMLEGLARFGVWRFCAGDAAASMDPLACAREVAEGAPLTTTGIKVSLADGGGERLVYASAARTNAFSAARNRDEALRKSAAFAVRALGELHRSGAAWLERCPECRSAGIPSALAPAAPDLKASAWDVLRLGTRAAWRGAQKLLAVDQWSIAYRFEETRGAVADLAGFRRLVPPRDRLWADPFPLTVAGRHFIFFEEMLFATGKAHLSVIEIARDGTCSKPRRVLERDYHLSYPFLFEHDGALYMVPESAQNRTVDLYRCSAFPYRWKLERTLLRGTRCADATLHHDGTRWWMFAGSAAEGAALDDELHLFHADSLAGEWRPHERNPVKSDVRSARPAGALFRDEQGLCRPAQVGAPRYGSAITIQRILRLTLSEFAEREARRIQPARADRVLGIHTYNHSGGLTVMDGFAYRLRIPFSKQG
jgi:hypothetical protein